ncbi:MAG: hypothetical protein ACRDHO_16765 [Actinomycetota bacterium]
MWEPGRRSGRRSLGSSWGGNRPRRTLLGDRWLWRRLGTILFNSNLRLGRFQDLRLSRRGRDRGNRLRGGTTPEPFPSGSVRFLDLGSRRLGLWLWWCDDLGLWLWWCDDLGLGLPPQEAFKPLPRTLFQSIFRWPEDWFLSGGLRFRRLELHVQLDGRKHLSLGSDLWGRGGLWLWSDGGRRFGLHLRLAGLRLLLQIEWLGSSHLVGECHLIGKVGFRLGSGALPLEPSPRGACLWGLLGRGFDIRTGFRLLRLRWSRFGAHHLSRSQLLECCLKVGFRTDGLLALGRWLDVLLRAGRLILR